MATVETQTMTADEFWEWADRPENEGRCWELERGTPIAIPAAGRLHGAVACLITYFLGAYMFRRKTGYGCSNGTALLVEKNPDTIRGPDVMLFEEKCRLEELSWKYATDVPRLVFEVLAPYDRPGSVIRRITEYLRRGIPLVWVVDPEDRCVFVNRIGQLQTLEETEELTGGDVLPDFRCRVGDFFRLSGESA